jgi:hypothetical protein
LPVKKTVFDSPETNQFSTSANIASCRFIILLFENEDQEVFELKQDVVGRVDTIHELKKE